MAKWKYLTGFLALITVLVWLVILSIPEKKLTLVACDVGQGDAILVTHGTTQVLFDGGPNNRVLTCLSKYMPFWDRTIEVVVLSHPQRDHYTGLIEVVKRYNVDRFVTSGLDASSPDYQVLSSLVRGGGTEVVTSANGIGLGDSAIYLDIVHPSQEYIASKNVVKEDDRSVLGTFTSNDNPNDYSVVVHLKYKNFDALLTGDIGPKVIEEIIKTGDIGDVEYIKVPHHGSKNGMTNELLQASTPEFAVISVGKNQWGHPHKEILDMLSSKNIQIFRTDESGDVVLISDGNTWEVKTN